MRRDLRVGALSLTMGVPACVYARVHTHVLVQGGLHIQISSGWLWPIEFVCAVASGVQLQRCEPRVGQFR